MPIYEFVCESCAHEFEKIVSFSAAVMPACPVCEGSDVKRRMSKPAIHFKGSGWYITDSKTDNKKSNGNGAGSSTKSTEGDDVKPVSSDNGAGESPKADSAKSESVKTDSAKAESSPKAAVKADG